MADHSYTEAVILEVLTGDGYFDIDYCFALGPVILSWSPRDGAFRRLRMEDNQLYKAVLAFLVKENKSLESPEDVRRLARTQNWARLDVLEQEIDALQQFQG